MLQYDNTKESVSLLAKNNNKDLYLTKTGIGEVKTQAGISIQ
jgi:hypothetical protein